jgi:hypothetical protein
LDFFRTNIIFKYCTKVTGQNRLNLETSHHVAAAAQETITKGKQSEETTEIVSLSSPILCAMFYQPLTSTHNRNNNGEKEAPHTSTHKSL